MSRKAADNALRIALDEFVGERRQPTQEEMDAFLTFVTQAVASWKHDLAQCVERPCCRFFMVGNVDYKGVYLPSPDEFEAHGYKRDLYDKFMEGWKKSIDEHGKL